MLLPVLIAMVAGGLQRHQQQVITYWHEEDRLLKAPCGGRRLRLTDTERRRLAALAHPIGRARLKELATMATPETLRRWYPRLIAQQFDGSAHHCRLGRPRVIEEIDPLVVRMAEEPPRWGYRRIQGAWANLGYEIDALTVRNIRRRRHRDPAPRRRQPGRSWTQSLRLHGEVLAAADFFAVEVATWHGLVTRYVLVVMALSTRSVQRAGSPPHPTDAFRAQCARPLTEPMDGFLLGKRSLLHERDTKFLHGFDQLLRASGVEPVVLPPRSPNLHAYGERCVRSLTEEALQQMIMSGEASLRTVLQLDLAHDHHESNHRGVGHQRMVAEPGMAHQRGVVVRRKRLGGLLSYYHREAA
jgi:putative transposase